MNNSMNKRFLALFFVTMLAGCGVDGGSDSEPISAPTPETGSSPEPVEEFDPVLMVSEITENVILPQYAAAANATEAFASETGTLSAYCDAIGTAEETSAFGLVQDDWRATMSTIQAIEMHAIGPVAENENALRNQILSYSAGKLSTCGIDISAILNEAGNFDVTARSLNQRGFGAIGYALFNSDLTHSCASQVPETQGWNERSEDERRIARCNLARVIAEDVASAATEVNEDWQTFGATFSSEDNVGDSLQLLTDGIFALDKLVKDLKLGVPLGINASCSAVACPEIVESIYSANSFANIRDNLVAFRNLFTGAEGSGFDDYIREEGFSDVSARFLDNTDAAIAIVDSATSTLHEESLSIVSNSQTSVCNNAFADPDTPSDFVGCRLTGAVKRITDDLKIDFVTIVGTRIPDSAQADND